MDKYELNLKIDQIKKLASKRAFKEAAKIAGEINWHKVKEWSALATIINVQEAVGDIEEARDMAILAYNRNLGGRKLVYKLTELFIKLKQFDEAEELYDEYEKMAAHDVNHYLLFYDLRKAEGARDNELIEILEEHKKHEVDEKYLLELAKLYASTDRKEECLKTCDEIVLLFQDGSYVEKAIQLKKEMGAELTNMQKKILEDTSRKKEDKEATKEILFEQQKELMRIMHDDIDDVFDEDEEAQADDIFEEHSEDEYTEELEDNSDEQDNLDKQDSFDEETTDTSSDESDISKSTDTTDIIEAFDDTEESEDVIEAFEDEQENAKKPSQMPESLRELIENAKKKIDSSYDRMNRESEEERLKEEKEAVKRSIEARENNMEIEVKVPNYSIYDTQNIQEELAKNLSKILSDDDEPDVFRPDRESVSHSDSALKLEAAAAEQDNQNQQEDDQIEGQMSLADWMEDIRQEKYGKQNTKEYSKEELEKMLDDKDEKSAAYEKLIMENKLKAAGANKEDSEVEARTKMMLHAAKTDLAIRTGKATLKLEEAVDDIREAAKEAQNEYTVTAEQADEDNTVISLDTASFAPVTEQMIAASVEKIVQDAEDENMLSDSVSEDIFDDEQEEINTNKVKRSQIVREKRIEESIAAGSDEEEDKKLTGELAKIFRKYREMPGLETQLVNLFEALDKEMDMTTSSVGNIIISGNSTSDKTDLARTIIRAINQVYPDSHKKIAKTTGDSINQRGITKAMSKLRGTALIVEGAGAIQPKRINEIMSCLSQDTDRMIVIFEDSDADINVLLNFNPDLVKMFNHRIVLKQYTVNELVDMAKRFARKRQYEVGDDALLELYLKIDKLRSQTDSIRLDDIKDIINQAIAKSEKRASKKLFGGLRKKRGDNGDLIFLSESDFKD